MSDEWDVLTLPRLVVFDYELSDGALRTLAQICTLAWDQDPSHPPGETRAAHWREFARLFDLSKSVYFQRIRTLRASGYLKIRSQAGRVVLKPAIPRFRNSGPTTTEESIPKSHEDSCGLSSSSTSAIPEFRNEAVFYLLTRAGIGEPLRSEVASDPEISTEWVEQHIAYAETRGDPRQLLAHRLKVRDPAPDICLDCEELDGRHDPNCETRRRQYLEGKFAGFISK